MKPILGVLAVLGWVARCQDIPLPDDHHHHGHGPSSDAGVPDDAAVSGKTCTSVPPGLYKEGFCDDQHLADGVRKYKPKYELWSDGAVKQRYVYLPPGKKIDTTNPDRWIFPLDTRFYKTFAVDGQRIETRMIAKDKNAAAGFDSWTFASYAWSADQQSVEQKVDPANPDAGVPDALGTDHDIPSFSQCKSCHSLVTNPVGDVINGFSAIQLNHHNAGFTLRELLDDGWLINLGPITVESARVPGDDTERAALGYLHANCGNCHGGSAPKGLPGTPATPLKPGATGLSLWVPVGSQLTDLPIYKTGACKCLLQFLNKKNADATLLTHRWVPGDSDLSAIVYRMSVRNSETLTRVQMPPLGTEQVDEIGLNKVRDFIDGIDPSFCELETMCPPPVAPTPPAAGAGGAGGVGGAAGSPAPMP